MFLFWACGLSRAQKMSLYALKSSNHANRTPTDRKTERAYHLLKFIGTEKLACPPSFVSAPLAKRRLVPPPVITEDDRRKGFDKAERKPGESQEAYDLRVRFRNKKRQEEWQWVVEGPVRPQQQRQEAVHTKYEGTEDLTQSSSYVVLIPDDSKGPGHYKIALLDHWVDLRKSFDQSAMKERLADLNKQKKMRTIAKENELNALRMEEDEILKRDEVFGAVLRKNLVREQNDWVKGQESSRQQRKLYRETGLTDLDQDENYGAEGGGKRRRAAKAASKGGGGDGEDDGESDDDYDAPVDHEHGLAIDRQGYDPDEFGDQDHDFDDDDDGAGEDMGEGMAGLQEGFEITAAAEELEANRQVADEDDDADVVEEPARSQSPDSSDSETEGPSSGQQRGKPPVSRTPMLATRRPAPQPTQALPSRPLSLKDRMQAFIVETTRSNNGKLGKEFFAREFTTRAMAHFGEQFDGNILTAEVRNVLQVKHNRIDGDFYVLKPEFQ
ncbi:hypothetical protein BASA81_003453 [Batrachochytrium salamandrivorans]|nr:hypothetical protein BASA81_003453 [Batrachochytrium salamandrivorans]